MKFNKSTMSLLLAGLCATATAQTTDDRFIIQVDNNKKGIVKALAQTMGAQLHIDGDGFLAATFSGKELSEVKGLLNNPHIKLIEVDQKRQLMGLYNDDAGDPMQQQVAPYAYYQVAGKPGDL